MRCNLFLIDQPVQHGGQAVIGIADEAVWLQIKLIPATFSDN
jgi:hypothetical protein